MTMANCFRKIIFRFSITKGKWSLPVQENPDHMGKNGRQKRILHPKKHRKQSFLAMAHFNIIFVDQCNLYLALSMESKKRFICFHFEERIDGMVATWDNLTLGKTGNTESIEGKGG